MNCIRSFGEQCDNYMRLISLLSVIADGVKPNPKFFSKTILTKGMKDGVVYKARNIYAPEKFCLFHARCSPSNEDHLELLGTITWKWNTASLGTSTYTLQGYLMYVGVKMVFLFVDKW